MTIEQDKFIAVATDLHDAREKSAEASKDLIRTRETDIFNGTRVVFNGGSREILVENAAPTPQQRTEKPDDFWGIVESNI
ncbi:MAG: hypothetical protein M1142_01410 [Patescibacteria group bacterium]|nr:hypothetical protein [Patescibacteria group bacterium]